MVTDDHGSFFCRRNVVAYNKRVDAFCAIILIADGVVVANRKGCIRIHVIRVAESAGVLAADGVAFADGDAVVAGDDVPRADGDGFVARRMGIGTDGDAARAAAGNRAAVCQFQEGGVGVFIQGIRIHFRAGGGVVANGQAVFPDSVGKPSDSSAVPAVSTCHPAHGQGFIAFRMGIGTHGDAAGGQGHLARRHSDGLAARAGEDQVFIDAHLLLFAVFRIVIVSCLFVPGHGGVGGGQFNVVLVVAEGFPGHGQDGAGKAYFNVAIEGIGIVLVQTGNAAVGQGAVRNAGSRNRKFCRMHIFQICVLLDLDMGPGYGFMSEGYGAFPVGIGIQALGYTVCTVGGRGQAECHGPLALGYRVGTDGDAAVQRIGLGCGGIGVFTFYIVIVDMVDLAAVSSSYVFTL